MLVRLKKPRPANRVRPSLAPLSANRQHYSQTRRQRYRQPQQRQPQKDRRSRDDDNQARGSKAAKGKGGRDRGGDERVRGGKGKKQLKLELLNTRSKRRPNRWYTKY